MLKAKSGRSVDEGRPFASCYVSAQSIARYPPYNSILHVNAANTLPWKARRVHGKGLQTSTIGCRESLSQYGAFSFRQKSNHMTTEKLWKTPFSSCLLQDLEIVKNFISSAWKNKFPFQKETLVISRYWNGKMFISGIHVCLFTNLRVTVANSCYHSTQSFSRHVTVLASKNAAKRDKHCVQSNTRLKMPVSTSVCAIYIRTSFMYDEWVRTAWFASGTKESGHLI